MADTNEFVQQIISGASVDEALAPAVARETELRRLFANDKHNLILQNLFAGLIDVFQAPEAVRTTRARIVASKEDLIANYVMPLQDSARRKTGTPACSVDLTEFKKNWSVFSEGALSQLVDWNNVVVAGGSILACLAPLPDSARASKRALRKHYHNAAYPTSDVDMFLYGMTPEQAEVKINQIYEAVRDSVPWDITVIRTPHTVSIHSQYPYRSIQIVLRLYQSPAEILAGFDVDAPCCAYDGANVWASPRCLAAMMRQSNTTDVTRRSPSYEVRLAKYAARGFEVYVPDLLRGDVDPTIYERSIVRVEGLARLLVLEKLADPLNRATFLANRRTLRGRPDARDTSSRYRRTLKGDLKADVSFAGLEMNDYDVASLHIPYGPGWDARRIDKLVYQTDLGMNSTFNPKNKGRNLHRHPAFFGTMVEALEDCCENCPEPVDDAEMRLQEEEGKHYTRGRVSFLEENPGRQTISGSFNPIDDGDWREQVYIGPTAKLFAAIAANERETVTVVIKGEGFDVNRRDHVGRAALHVAIICKSTEIACDLVDAGARITARLVDGRTSLHLAAQYGLLVVVRKLLEKSALNKEAEAEKTKEKTGDDEAGSDDVDVDVESAAPGPKSSEDDWSSSKEDMDVDMGDLGEDEDEDKSDGEMDVDDEGGDDDDDEDNEPRRRKKKAAAKEDPAAASAATGETPVDNEEEPDVLEIDTPDWDFAFTPLAYAILFSDLTVIEALLTSGADPKHVPKVKVGGKTPFHPLTLALLVESDKQSSTVAERLIMAGASSSTADSNSRTLFHQAVSSNRTSFVSTLLRCDPKAKICIDFPVLNYHALCFPLISSIGSGHYSMTTLLLAHGAKYVFKEADVSKARAIADPKGTRSSHNSKVPLSGVDMPIEAAMSRVDEVAHLLAGIGCEVSLQVKESIGYYDVAGQNITLLDYTRLAIKSLSNQILIVLANESTASMAAKGVPLAGRAPTWKAQLEGLISGVKYVAHMQSKNNQRGSTNEDKEKARLFTVKEYFVGVEKMLLARGAKTFAELDPDAPQLGEGVVGQYILRNRYQHNEVGSQVNTYKLHTNQYYSNKEVYTHLVPLYDQLYEACWTGDDAKIRALCLPVEGAAPDAQELLQISVQTAQSHNTYEHTGHTPLSVAIMAQQWETARVVMSIAAAQYVPEDKKNGFSTRGIDLDNDSDSGSDSEDSEGSVASSVKFTDIAVRVAKVETQTSPKKMLMEVPCIWLSKEKDEDESHRSTTLLDFAIQTGDFQAFVKIADLYKSLPIPVSLADGTTLDTILRADRAEMLDEYIRRTGDGVDPVVEPVEGEPVEEKVQKKSKTYLGLSVHGKKRHDLVSRNDPDAAYNAPLVPASPLLWQAAAGKATSIVAYLGGERPLVAYKYYMSTHSDERAERLRKASNLDVVLPDWLGWKVGPLGDSALTAAILGKSVEVLDALFTKAPKVMQATLSERIKFIGFNPIMLACHLGCSVELFDFLLAKGVSATENDQIRMWNILHMLASSSQTKLLKHVLTKIPQDALKLLLAQPSKGRLSTPLHLAVVSFKPSVVQTLLDTGLCNLLMRNVDGYTPLHLAVQNGSAKITKMVADASPADAVHLENGIGHTVLDTASLHELLWRTTDRYPALVQNCSPQSLSVSSQPRLEDFNVSAQEKEIPKLRATIEQLVGEGRLHENTKMTKQLFSFAERMEKKLVFVKKLEADEAILVEKLKDGEEVAEPSDSLDRTETLKVIRELVEAHPGARQLVHLIDVQRSVQANLSKVVAQQKAREKQQHVDYDALGPELVVDEVQKQKNESQVLSMVHIQPEQDDDGSEDSFAPDDWESN